MKDNYIQIINELEKKFRNANLSDLITDRDFIDNYLISKTKDGRIFPPYIPLVGKNYFKFRILVYATAQNINEHIREIYSDNYHKLILRLYYPYINKNEFYPYQKIKFNEIAIAPYNQGVLPNLLALFLLKKFALKVQNLNEVIDYIAVSNYYKFSLRKGKRDLNPERSSFPNMSAYYNLNDLLVKQEIECLNPKVIIVFKGRKVSVLRKGFKEKNIIEINDPAWILRGMNGVYKKGKSWWKQAQNCNNFDKYIDELMLYIKGRYGSKKEAIKVYLKKYCAEW